MKSVLLSWSSGKDSAWALHLLRQQPDVRVAALVTTFNTTASRVAMHAVRRTLVEAQAERTGIPLWQVELPSPCANQEYEESMRVVCQRAVAEGIAAVAAVVHGKVPQGAEMAQLLGPAGGENRTESRHAVEQMTQQNPYRPGTRGHPIQTVGRQKADQMLRNIELLVDLCQQRGENHSSPGGFLCLGFFRVVLGRMVWEGLTVPTRSRAIARTSLD